MKSSSVLGWTLTLPVGLLNTALCGDGVTVPAPQAVSRRDVIKMIVLNLLV
jgi:hypothetical protein